MGDGQDNCRIPDWLVVPVGQSWMLWHHKWDVELKQNHTASVWAWSRNKKHFYDSWRPVSKHLAEAAAPDPLLQQEWKPITGITLHANRHDHLRLKKRPTSTIRLLTAAHAKEEMQPSRQRSRSRSRNTSTSATASSSTARHSIEASRRRQPQPPPGRLRSLRNKERPTRSLNHK